MDIGSIGCNTHFESRMEPSSWNAINMKAPQKRFLHALKTRPLYLYTVVRQNLKMYAARMKCTKHGVVLGIY